MSVTRSILKNSINAWDRFCEWLFRKPAWESDVLFRSGSRVVFTEMPCVLEKRLIDQQQIQNLWDDTVESQFDIEWDELGEDTQQQLIRFANAIRERG